MKIRPVRRNYAARFLATVLKGKQAKLCQGRGLSMAKNAENTAFLVKFIESEIHRQLDIDDLIHHFVRRYSVHMVSQTLSNHLWRIIGSNKNSGVMFTRTKILVREGLKVNSVHGNNGKTLFGGKLKLLGRQFPFGRPRPWL